MNLFSKYSHHKAVVIIDSKIELPITEAQVRILRYEMFNLRFQGYNQEMNEYCLSITHDGKRSFVFIFDEKVLQLPHEKQKLIVDVISELFKDSNFYCSMISIEFARDPDLNEGDFHELWLNSYSDSMLSLKYNLSLDTMLRELSLSYSKDEIEQEYLIQKLKRPDRCVA